MKTMMHFTDVKWKNSMLGPKEFYYINEEHPNDFTRAVACLESLERDSIVQFHVKLVRVITANKEHHD